MAKKPKHARFLYKKTDGSLPDDSHSRIVIKVKNEHEVACGLKCPHKKNYIVVSVKGANPRFGYAIKDYFDCGNLPDYVYPGSDFETIDAALERYGMTLKRRWYKPFGKYVVPKEHITSY